MGKLRIWRRNWKASQIFQELLRFLGKPRLSSFPFKANATCLLRCVETSNSDITNWRHWYFIHITVPWYLLLHSIIIRYFRWHWMCLHINCRKLSSPKYGNPSRTGISGDFSENPPKEGLSQKLYQSTDDTVAVIHCLESRYRTDRTPTWSNLYEISSSLVQYLCVQSVNNIFHGNTFIPDKKFKFTESVKREATLLFHGISIFLLMTNISLKMQLSCMQLPTISAGNNNSLQYVFSLAFSCNHKYLKLQIILSRFLI